MEFMSFWTLDRVLEFAGLVTGLACVWLLIRQHIATWPLGIVYVFLSLYIFWGGQALRRLSASPGVPRVKQLRVVGLVAGPRG